VIDIAVVFDVWEKKYS